MLKLVIKNEINKENFLIKNEIEENLNQKINEL